jgi:FemAB-related protein (PEP-CTERM system-associated)
MRPSQTNAGLTERILRAPTSDSKGTSFPKEESQRRADRICSRRGSPTESERGVLEIRALQTQNDEKRWDEFARHHTSSTLYHQTGWKNAVERAYGHKAHYLFAEDGADVVGIFPLFLVKDLLSRKALISLPFAPYGGICSTDLSVSEQLLSQARRLMTDLGASYIEMRCCAASSATANLPVNHQYVAAVYKIPGGSDEAWRRMNKNRRKKVRKAQNNGLTAEICESGQGTEAFYGLYVRNMHDLGTPVHSARFFRHVVNEFPNSTRVALVRHDGRAVAGTLLLLRGSILICGWGASLKEYLWCEPNDLLYWEVIRCGCEQGFREIDFGRSLAGSGNATFKREWGATETGLEYRYILNGTCDVPNVNTSNPNYDRLSRVWRCLPLTIVNRLGPIIRKRVA